MTKYLHKTHRKKNPQTIAQKGSKPISEAGSWNLFLSEAWKSIITYKTQITEILMVDTENNIKHMVRK